MPLAGGYRLEYGVEEDLLKSERKTVVKSVRVTFIEGGSLRIEIGLILGPHRVALGTLGFSETFCPRPFLSCFQDWNLKIEEVTGLLRT